MKTLQTDLTILQPQDIRNKDIAGLCGIARIADKARTAHIGKLGGYTYGNASKQDKRILAFLGISAEDFQKAAVDNPSNSNLSAWVLDNCKKSPEAIQAFNQSFVLPNASPRCGNIYCAPAQIGKQTHRHHLLDRGCLAVATLVRQVMVHVEKIPESNLYHEISSLDKREASHRHPRIGAHATRSLHAATQMRPA